MEEDTITGSRYEASTATSLTSENDEFEIIERDLKYDSEDPETQTDPMNSSTDVFMVLSQRCKSWEAKDMLKSAISDSLTESANDMQLSESNVETSGVHSISSNNSSSEMKKQEGVEEANELLQSKLKDLLQDANDTIQMNENQINQLQEELLIKNKKIEELEKRLQNKEAQRSKEYDVQKYQSLYKQDQLKIYELETEIKKMEREMKQVNNSNSSKFEDITKSIHELQSMTAGGLSCSSSSVGDSIRDLDSIIIEKNMNELKISQSEDDTIGQATIETSSLSSESEKLPRILDDGRVVMVKNSEMESDAHDDLSFRVNYQTSYFLPCPMCDLTFDMEHQSELEEHVQIHLDEDSEEEMERVAVSQKDHQGGEGISPFGAVRNVFQFVNTLGRSK